MWASGDHEVNDSPAPVPTRKARLEPLQNTTLWRAVARPGTLTPRAPQLNSSTARVPSPYRWEPLPRQPRLPERLRDALRSCHYSRFGIVCQLGLQASYEIRTVREPLGHKNAKTAVKCTHVLNRGG